MADIYEEIWSHPESHVPVSRDPSSTAAVILKEGSAAESSDCSSADATDPLFTRVDEAIFDQPTFATFIALLDDYTAEEGREELGLDDPDHAAAVEAFLDAIFPTGPMRLAVAHVESTLGLSEAELRDRVRSMWFEPFTNNFGAREDFCVGFEHVFIGEAPDRSPQHCRDSVGGYHSWVKYYLDQKAEKATYLGHDYEDPVAAEGLADPHVATVVMTWEPDGDEGGIGEELLKKPGGFFVGTRPECEIAIASVGLLELLNGGFDQGNQEDHHRVRFGDSSFDLVLHPETVRRSPKQLGPHLRTFYPKFRGAADGTGDDDERRRRDRQDGGVSIPTQPHNSGAIRIARALPNPEGSDEGTEWVELRNASEQDLPLDGWRLTDRLGRPQALAGTIAAGETRRIIIERAGPNAMQLGNDGGWLLLFEGAERRAAVRYGRAAQGRIFELE